MKKLKYIICILIILIFFLVTLLFIALYKNNNFKDSIVFIESLNEEKINTGMGFVYKIEDNSNYIVTNYHVIAENDRIIVYNLDKKKEYASVVNYDSYSDIAILKIEDKLNLQEVSIGINNEQKNDRIYYYNLDKKNIDYGFVLELDNEITISSNYGNSFYSVTSVSGNITEGNSGGPIFNKENEVIGLLSLKEENTDIAFYIPIDFIMDIVAKLENHTLIRPNLGAIMCNTINKDILNQYGININNINGVVVLEVEENYPLSLVNIRKGDVITKVNDVVIEKINDLQREIYSYNLGDTITLEYYRDDTYNTVDITLDK